VLNRAQGVVFAGGWVKTRAGWEAIPAAPGPSRLPLHPYSFAEDFVLGVGAPSDETTKRPGQAAGGTLDDERGRGATGALAQATLRAA